MTQEDDQKGDIALAGEYALRLLDGPEQTAFEQRLETEPQLQQLLREWEASLAPLASSIAPVPPPGRIRAQLQQKLFAQSPRRRPWWPWLTGALLAATLTLAALWLPQWNRTTAPSSPMFEARIAAEDRSLVLAIAFTPETGLLQIDHHAGAPAAGRSFELWLIAQGSETPQSLGILATDTPQTLIEVPPAHRTLIPGATLAISDEPLGGSPSGAPTGPVIGAGPVIAL
jgi:anti-sigma-K factor RskA